MSHELRQTRRFARQYKKLHDNLAADWYEAHGIGRREEKIRTVLRVLP